MTTDSDKRALSAYSSRKRKLTLSLAGVLCLGSFSSLILVGFSWGAIFLGCASFIYGVASFLFHYVKSGAYLPDITNEKSLRQKFISMKFKGNTDTVIAEKCIQLIEKKTALSKRFKILLDHYFNETELTYSRYLNLWHSFEEVLEEELSHIYSRLLILNEISSDTNKSDISNKVDAGIEAAEKLLNEGENLLISFDQEKSEDNHQEIFNQLKIMSERTKNYLK